MFNISRVNVGRRHHVATCVHATWWHLYVTFVCVCVRVCVRACVCARVRARGRVRVIIGSKHP